MQRSPSLLMYGETIWTCVLCTTRWPRSFCETALQQPPTKEFWTLTKTNRTRRQAFSKSLLRPHKHSALPGMRLNSGPQGLDWWYAGMLHVQCSSSRMCKSGLSPVRGSQSLSGTQSFDFVLEHGEGYHPTPLVTRGYVPGNTLSIYLLMDASFDSLRCHSFPMNCCRLLL
jgi:hypothetical protein